jgi:hypothetical protein
MNSLLTGKEEDRRHTASCISFSETAFPPLVPPAAANDPGKGLNGDPPLAWLWFCSSFQLFCLTNRSFWGALQGVLLTGLVGGGSSVELRTLLATLEEGVASSSLASREEFGLEEWLLPVVREDAEVEWGKGERERRSPIRGLVPGWVREVWRRTPEDVPSAAEEEIWSSYGL